MAGNGDDVTDPGRLLVQRHELPSSRALCVSSAVGTPEPSEVTPIAGR
jgi:hypothetical protein